MEISEKLAEKYAAYRTRYLFGSSGIYNQESPGANCTLPRAILQSKGFPVPFLRHNAEQSSRPGTYLQVDRLILENQGRLESADIKDIAHGDNIIYSSYAALAFIAEYSILHSEESLRICLGIIKSHQRLGTYQSGLNEDHRQFQGYMLRADSPDENNNVENICVWADDPENAKNLEPSYDQYCGALSCYRFIQLILADTQSIPAHALQRSELEAALSERIEAIVLYLSVSFWTILWTNRSGTNRLAHRGPFCIHAAFPFARIAALSAASNVDRYFNKPFPLNEIPGFPGTGAMDGFATALRNFASNAVGRLEACTLDQLVAANLDRIANLDEVSKFVGGRAELKDLVRDRLKAITDVVDPINRVLQTLLADIEQWSGRVVGAAAIPISIFLHRYYSKAMLQDFGDALDMPLSTLLSLFGITPPADIEFRFNIGISIHIGSPPSWWPSWLDWEGWDWDFNEDFDIRVPLDWLGDLPVPVGLLDPLGLIVSGTAGAFPRKRDLQLLVFLNNAASDTFGPNQIDPVQTSFANQDAFMMATTYRFFPQLFSGANGPPNLTKLRNVMDSLVTAPDTFPNGDARFAPWNQNFRWMRERSSDRSVREIYSGLDFMLPLILAGSVPASRDANRAILRDALSAKFEEDCDMGPFKLPFQGPYTGQQLVFSPKAGGTQNETVVYLSVVFERGRDSGSVTIHYKDLAGSDQNEVFHPNEPGKLIAVPLKDQSITMTVADSIRGYVAIESSD